MTRRVRRSRRRWGTGLLLVLCLALAGLIVEELRFPIGVALGPDLPVDAAAGTSLPPAASDQDFAAPPREAYGDILARPLFLPSRRPVKREEAGPAAPPPLPFTLSGIAAIPDHRVALVQAGNPPRLLQLTEGQEIGGWTIASIATDRVVIRYRDTTAEVRLKDRPPSSAQAASPGAKAASQQAPPPASTATLPQTQPARTQPAQTQPTGRARDSRP